MLLLRSFCLEMPFSLYPPTYSLEAFLVFPVKCPWKLIFPIPLCYVLLQLPLQQTSLLFLPLIGKASSHWFASLPFLFHKLKDDWKQEAICFLVWDILDIFHTWNNKSDEWVFSLLLLEVTLKTTFSGHNPDVCSPYRRYLLSTGCSFISQALS